MAAYFAVQSYRKGNKGALIEDAPLVVNSEAAALRRALSLSRSKAGAVAFKREANEFDEFGGPTFLVTYGEVPEFVAEAMEIPF